MKCAFGVYPVLNAPEKSLFRSLGASNVLVGRETMSILAEISSGPACRFLNIRLDLHEC